MSDTTVIEPEIVGVPDKPSPLAVASLTCGVVGLLTMIPGFCCVCATGLALILGGVAIVLGFVELRRISAGQSCPKGRWMAIAGVVSGALACVAFVIYIIVMIALYGMSIFKLGPFR